MVEEFEDGADAMQMATSPCPSCNHNDRFDYVEDQQCFISWPCTKCESPSAFSMTQEEYCKLMERDPEEKEIEQKQCIHCGHVNGKGFQQV